MIDLSKAEKLPPEHRYFNISVLWIFYYRSLLKLLYRLKIPHDIVTYASIAAGLVAAYLFATGPLILGAISLHLKDLFDSCDGALARLTGKGHLIGRYLDSLGDFFVLTAVVFSSIAFTLNRGQSTFIFWGIVAEFSIFLQCSFFNFYQLAYLEQYDIQTLTSKRDESSRADIDQESGSGSKRRALSLLHSLYIVIYSWQDRFVAAVDNYFYKRCPLVPRNEWYGSKKMMTLQSPLCFGTHIFVFIVFALLGRIEYALVFIGTVMNLYTIWLLYYRRRYFLRAVAQVEQKREMSYGSKM